MGSKKLTQREMAVSLVFIAKCATKDVTKSRDRHRRAQWGIRGPFCAFMANLLAFFSFSRFLYLRLLTAPTPAST